MNLQEARAKVNALTFGTAEWEAAMEVVRGLVDAESQSAPKEEFCSLDSPQFRTRLCSGKII